MKVLPATVEDIPTLQPLVQSCYRGESSRRGWTHEADLVDGIRITEDNLQEDMSKPGVQILKFLDAEDTLIGCVYTEIENDKMHVGMLCVRPDLQGAGLGKEIMKTVDDLAKAKGCCAAKIQVISVRRELIQWYERRGFRNTGEISPFPAGDAHGTPKMPLNFIVMQKDF